MAETTPDLTPDLTLALGQDHLSVEPGTGTGCDVRIGNTGSDAADLRLELLGPAAAWSLVTPAHLTVPAGGQAVARLIVRPNRSPDLSPGPVPFTVAASGVGSPAPVAEAIGSIEVKGYADIEARLTPRHARTRRTSKHRVEVDNRGTQATTVAVTATPASDALTVEATPGTAELAPGGTITIALVAHARQPHVGRRARPHHFAVELATEGGPTTHFEATLDQQPTRWALPVALLAVVAGLGGLVLALGASRATPVASTGPAPAAEAPPLPDPVYAVGARTETFVDPSRPTRLPQSLPPEPSRTLETLILYPAAGEPGTTIAEGAEPASGQGPFPLVVYAHGSGGPGQRYSPMLQAWAAAGYVVVVPTFPAARNPEQTTADDYVNQPADMSFVTDEVLQANEDDGAPLHGLIDPEHLAAAGHSLGAMTTLGLVANTCCHDPRFDAGVVLAGREVPFPEGDFYFQINTPLLFIHGDADASVRYADGRLAYRDAPPAKFLVTLFGGDHGEPFGGEPDIPHARVVVTTTLDFFDHYLRGAPDGLDHLRTHGNVAGVSEVEAEV